MGYLPLPDPQHPTMPVASSAKYVTEIPGSTPSTKTSWSNGRRFWRGGPVFTHSTSRSVRSARSVGESLPRSVHASSPVTTDQFTSAHVDHLPSRREALPCPETQATNRRRPCASCRRSWQRRPRGHPSPLPTDRSRRHPAGSTPRRVYATGRAARRLVVDTRVLHRRREALPIHPTTARGAPGSCRTPGP